MADNVVLNSGSGGDTAAADEIPAASGIKYQRVKITLGADGTNDGDVASGNPMPVDMGTNNDVTVQGEDAENAAVTANPVLVGGRYDLTPRTLGDGDVGGVALDPDGAIHISDGGNVITVDGTVAVSGTVTVDGSGVTQPVSGTVTANLGATDNAVLDSIDAAVNLIDNANATIGTTDVVRVAIFDNANTQITSFGGGTQYAADAALGTTPTGTVAIAQRDDALSTLTPVEGDAVPLRVGSTGALWVDIASVPAGSAEIVDDAAFTPASTSVVMMGFEFDDTTPDSVDEGDGGAARMSANRNIYTQLRDAAGNERGANIDASNRLTVLADLGTTDNAVLDNIDTQTAAIQTATQIIDNTIFADDAAFTLASSSVNMAGAIRDDALSTLTAVEGDAVPLRVSSTGALHVTGGGGGTQYNIDDASPTVVTMAGVVRDDSLTTLTEVDGDATVLRVSSTGALHVTGGGGGTEYTEDVATANPIVGTATLMERDDALTTVTPIEGDWIAFRGTAEGALWVQDFNSDAILADTANMDTNLTTIAGAVSGTEMQVDVITSALPSGAATAAKQPALGTAGTASSDVITVQGITSMTPLVVDLGANNDVTVTGTVTVDLGANNDVNVTQMNSTAVSMGNGASGTGVQRVTIASDSTGVIGHNTTNLADGVTTVTTAGTDVALAGSTTAKWVIIQAQTDNTGIIAVGNTGVDATVATGTGVALAAGESITIPCDNLSDIFIDSTVNGEGVRYTYGT